jgi:hypothetical protein
VTSPNAVVALELSGGRQNRRASIKRLKGLESSPLLASAAGGDTALGDAEVFG